MHHLAYRQCVSGLVLPPTRTSFHGHFNPSIRSIMRFAFSSLVALVAATAAVAQPALHVKRSIQINPDRGSIRPEFADEVASSAPAPEPQTNAKRFAAGLPPLAPRGHRRRVHRGGPYAGKSREFFVCLCLLIWV